VKVGDKLELMPFGEKVIVKGIESVNEMVEHAYAGQLCDLSLGLPKDFDSQYMKAGQVLCQPNWPVYQVTKFRAKILVYETDLIITKGQ